VSGKRAFAGFSPAGEGAHCVIRGVGRSRPRGRRERGAAHIIQSCNGIERLCNVETPACDVIALAAGLIVA
jgi:hypothetical protein